MSAVGIRRWGRVEFRDVLWLREIMVVEVTHEGATCDSHSHQPHVVRHKDPMPQRRR
jgi:hypothetical protein